MWPDRPEEVLWATFSTRPLIGAARSLAQCVRHPGEPGRRGAARLAGAQLQSGRRRNVVTRYRLLAHGVRQSMCQAEGGDRRQGGCAASGLLGLRPAAQSAHSGALARVSGEVLHS